MILLHPCWFSFQKDKLFHQFVTIELTVCLTSRQGGGAREPADRQPDGPQQPLHPGGPREQLLSHVCTKKRQEKETQHKPQKHYCMSRDVSQPASTDHQPGSRRLGGEEWAQGVTDSSSPTLPHQDQDPHWPNASCPPGGLMTGRAVLTGVGGRRS